MSFKEHTLDLRFQELLVAVKEEHCDMSVTSNTDDTHMEGWNTAQNYSDSNLQTDNQDSLKCIDLVARQENFCRDQWEESCRRLSELFIEHGRAFEPDINSALGRWTALQRNLHSRGLLHLDLKCDLDEIGFSWTPLDRFVDCAESTSAAISRDVVEKTNRAEIWNSQFAALVRHREIFGHFLVSSRYDVSLQQWLNIQRRRQREGSLPKRKVEQLNSIGFVWSDGHKPFSEEIWEHMYTRLKTFSEEHGHCVVDNSNCIDEDLIVWAIKQRRQWNMRPDRMAKLALLGYAWNLKSIEVIVGPRSPGRGCFHHKRREQIWTAKYELAVKHHEQFGHTLAHKSNSTLHHWLSWQRTLHGKGKLCKCREERLNNIQFVWTEAVQRRDQSWDTMYEQLQAFYEKHGTCCVNTKASGYQQLGHWVNQQNMKIIEGAMMPERKVKLDLLGFSRNTEEGDVLHSEDGVNTATRIAVGSNLPVGHKSSRDENWEMMYERLKAYKEKHGYCLVRNSECNNEQQLKLWVTTQRRAGRQNNRPDRMEKLALLGFFYNDKGRLDAQHIPCRAKTRGMKRGAEYLEAEIDDKVLTVKVRVDDKVWTLEVEDKLIDVPVEYSSREKQFHSHLRVKASGGSRHQDSCASEKATAKNAAPDDDFPQIQNDRPGTLGCSSTAPAIDLQNRPKPSGLAGPRPRNLASLDECWNEKYDELVNYYHKFGHSSVLMNDDFQLYSWCCRQRLILRQGKLPQSRVEKLKMLEFPVCQDRLTRDEQWEAMFKKLKAYIEQQGRLPCLQVNDKCNNKLVGWLRAQHSGIRVDRRRDWKAKLALLGVRWKPQKGKADVLPYLSTHPSMKKITARRPEHAGRGADLCKVSDSPVLSCHNAREGLIYLCENADEVSSNERVSATSRKPRKISTPACSKPNIVIHENRDPSEGGEIKREPHPTLTDTSKDSSDMVDENHICNHSNGDTDYGDGTLRCIPNRKVIDDDVESLLKGREEALPAMQRELDMTNSTRKRQRSLKCRARMNRHDQIENLVNVSFLTGSVGLRVIAKLQEKKRTANATGRFRRKCGL